MKIKQQIQKLLDELNEGVYEKREVIALTLLTAIAGESIFLLGAPGVAKSLIARRLKFAFRDGSAFEYLMNRFSTPDEIFGPVSISKLKDEDKYERIVKNYLPSATVVFLDEIWKAGPSIQNVLLTVLNEKVYRNGEQEIKVPLKALISASNELPLKGEGLEALWDRFLVRVVVEGVKDKNNFNEMISKSLKSYEDNVSPSNSITEEQYNNMSALIDEVDVPENILNVIQIIRNYLDQHNKKVENKENQIYISDRRWKKIVRLLRTSAFLNERKVVDLMDCFLINHCLWDETEQTKTVSQFVKDSIQKHGYKLDIDLKDLKSEIKDFDKEVKEETSYLKPILKKRLLISNKDFIKIVDHYEYYIRLSDFNSLKVNDVTTVELFSTSDQINFYRQTNKYCKKGNEKFSILISTGAHYGNNSQQYKLETEEFEEKIVATKKPHHATQKHWDNEVSKFFTITSNLKLQLDQYRKTDLDHLSKNLFVNPSFVDVVVTNLDDTQKEIEKLEVKVREIKHYYENVEDQTQTDLKQPINEKE